LVVVDGFMHSHRHECEQIQLTNNQAFYQRGSVKLWKGKLCSLLIVNAEKWGVKIKNGGDVKLLLPNCCVLPALSSHLSVFSKFCVMNTLLHFLLLLCHSCRSLSNVSFGGHILGLIEGAYHGWLDMMTSLEGPPFQTCLGTPKLKPTTACEQSSPWIG